MWLQLGIAAAFLAWLATRKPAAAAPPPAPFVIPTGGYTGAGEPLNAITYHEGAGDWDTPAPAQNTSKTPEECDYACQGFIL